MTQIKVSPTCVLLLLVLGLEIPRESEAVNVGWLLLVLSLEQLSKRYRGWGPAAFCLIGFTKL